jgi:hypothetical protein
VRANRLARLRIVAMSKTSLPPESFPHGTAPSLPLRGRWARYFLWGVLILGTFVAAQWSADVAASARSDAERTRTEIRLANIKTAFWRLNAQLDRLRALRGAPPLKGRPTEMLQ